ncbi:hypothetical protein KIL84_014870 [Mauremys mutica]|uniref:Uncharacterized protein n=1 Tax=Mauremys mutica TaxID=74926 RepID=A0A9D3XMI9_9SAUR|nr:hypothetical protein KIL84_014870 [Mauremys mutica]
MGQNTTLHSCEAASSRTLSSLERIIGFAEEVKRLSQKGDARQLKREGGLGEPTKREKKLSNVADGAEELMEAVMILHHRDTTPNIPLGTNGLSETQSSPYLLSVGLEVGAEAPPRGACGPPEEMHSCSISFWDTLHACFF